MSDEWFEKNKFAVLFVGLFFSFILFAVTMFSRSRAAEMVMAIVTIAFAFSLLLYIFKEKQQKDECYPEENTSPSEKEVDEELGISNSGGVEENDDEKSKEKKDSKESDEVEEYNGQF